MGEDTAEGPVQGDGTEDHDVGGLGGAAPDGDELGENAEGDLAGGDGADVQADGALDAGEGGVVVAEGCGGGRGGRRGFCGSRGRRRRRRGT